MVAFTKADMPNDINTVEGVAAWASTVLSTLHLGVEVQEAVGILEPVAMSQPIPWRNPTNGNAGHRYIVRASLELEPNYLDGSLKIWRNVKTLSNAAIPAAFKA
jgi:hypothetical protein